MNFEKQQGETPEQHWKRLHNAVMEAMTEAQDVVPAGTSMANLRAFTAAKQMADAAFFMMRAAANT